MANDLSKARKRRSLGHYYGATSGNISIIVAICMPVLMGAVGLAADFAQYINKQTELQAAADSAAIAAAKELSLATASDSTIVSAANAFVTAAFPTDVTAGVEINRQTSSVKVSVSETWTPVFAHYLGTGITPVSVSATASLSGGSNICVLTLHPSVQKSIELKRNAVLKGNGCAIYANSSSSSAISATTNSTITADSVCSVGGVVMSGGTIKPDAVTDCPVVEDPLASRPAPNIGVCKETNLIISSGTHTLDPGTYCGGISITDNAVVKFNEGTYTIKNGNFSVSGNAKVSGDHVGFYITGDTAVLFFATNTSVSFSGPKSGSMAGILFFEDRNSPPNKVHQINSTKAHTLTGTIYMPSGILRVNPRAMVAQNSAYTAIVAGQLEVFDGPELILNTNYSATDVPVPAGIRASSDVVLSD